MKLADYRGEEALDLLADLVEPASKIFGDPEVLKVIRGEGTKAQVIKAMLKGHKVEVLEILARIEGVPVGEYEFNVLTLPAILLDIFNDNDLMGLFQLQGQQTGVKSFGSAKGTTEE